MPRCPDPALFGPVVGIHENDGRDGDVIEQTTQFVPNLEGQITAGGFLKALVGLWHLEVREVKMWWGIFLGFREP
jgi:hypothetical protein